MDVVGVSKRPRRLAEAHVVVYDAVPVRQQRHIQYRTTRAGDAAHPQPRSAPEAPRICVFQLRQGNLAPGAVSDSPEPEGGRDVQAGVHEARGLAGGVQEVEAHGGRVGVGADDDAAAGRGRDGGARHGERMPQHVAPAPASVVGSAEQAPAEAPERRSAALDAEHAVPGAEYHGRRRGVGRGDQREVERRRRRRRLADVAAAPSAAELVEEHDLTEPLLEGPVAVLSEAKRVVGLGDAGGALGVGAAEARVGDEGAPALAHGEAAGGAARRQAEQDVPEQVVRQTLHGGGGFVVRTRASPTNAAEAQPPVLRRERQPAADVRRHHGALGHVGSGHAAAHPDDDDHQRERRRPVRRVVCRARAQPHDKEAGDDQTDDDEDIDGDDGGAEEEAAGSINDDIDR
uniref:Uncharacterized protein n=1 Tax=Oryza glumipatula TaxID=40148 RepID=A0A0D9Z844_9ORYZ